ncbi:DUF1992 domain-containing protein [Spongiactinospora gelatinilytica]|uniref:DUF1992 domain-containing protein n=1 Tax=Spongiactinospora gelatinilytica TaxID=2666298 RepID=A0A2W2FJI8_9ACTN|nr:DUF1992 domain-containing protein [Spongiactinospora gelatinilytica]PZG24878.1 DUF1992 domain-containing protein [Spongiactinospora gelatinilytica]
MTNRKPDSMGFESWIDQQIREAMERGEFDDLPGAGKPLPNRNEVADELWWVKQKALSEGRTLPLPPTLALRKEAEEALAAARGARTENQARKIVEEINQKIDQAIRKGLSGPPLNLMPFDVEQIITEWRDDNRG